MSSEEPTKKTYGRFDPRGLTLRKAGLIMGMGFAGLLIAFALTALQELK